MSSDLITVEDGEFAGWSRSESNESFTGHVGPYYYKSDDNGHFKVAFKAEKHHLNGGGTVHGGCLLTLADTSLFIFSLPHLNGGGAVTVQLDAQFLSPGREGDIIIASGEITRAGASTVFGRGELRVGNRIILTFSGVLKRTRPASGDA